jgi:hypothetical protein
MNATRHPVRVRRSLHASRVMAVNYAIALSAPSISPVLLSNSSIFALLRVALRLVWVRIARLEILCIVRIIGKPSAPTMPGAARIIPARKDSSRSRPRVFITQARRGLLGSLFVRHVRELAEGAFLGGAVAIVDRLGRIVFGRDRVRRFRTCLRALSAGGHPEPVKEPESRNTCGEGQRGNASRCLHEQLHGLILASHPGGHDVTVWDQLRGVILAGGVRRTTGCAVAELVGAVPALGSVLGALGGPATYFWISGSIEARWTGAAAKAIATPSSSKRTRDRPQGREGRKGRKNLLVLPAPLRSWRPWCVSSETVFQPFAGTIAAAISSALLIANSSTYLPNLASSRSSSRAVETSRGTAPSRVRYTVSSVRLRASTP